MEVAAILDDQANREPLASAASLMAARGGSAEGERLKVLVDQIEACGRRHFPLDLRVSAGTTRAAAHVPTQWTPRR